jgi:predicted nucleic acid-binding protein
MARRTGRPLRSASAFWDTSLLVPLCIPQSASSRAIRLRALYDVVVWWSTSLEIASAIARLERMKELDIAGAAKARKTAGDLAVYWSVVQPSDALLARAVQFVTRYDLRAADALQLAAAWEWCEGLPSGRIFLTINQRLSKAAILTGFDVK